MRWSAHLLALNHQLPTHLFQLTLHSPATGRGHIRNLTRSGATDRTDRCRTVSAALAGQNATTNLASLDEGEVEDRGLNRCGEHLAVDNAFTVIAGHFENLGKVSLGKVAFSSSKLGRLVERLLEKFCRLQ